ncbi:cyclic GMP-AMP synthase isoform X1 [Tiliqua scincoides]|uniref:cyclic GMP-AMP synthase isoform X1 n=1 Tax=Tiliqua scincoides TaxID=71010 RepID=UPI003461F296
MGGRGKGCRKASAAKPPQAPHARGAARDAPEEVSSPPPPLGAGPARTRAARGNGGQECAPGGRNAAQRRREGAPQAGEPAQAGRRTEPEDGRKPGAARGVQARAPKAEEPGPGRAAAACRRESGEGRRASQKGKGVAPQAEPAAAAAAPQAQRDGSDAAPQKKRASQKAKAPDPKPFRSLREVLKTIALRQEAVSRASKRVNRVRDLLVAAIKKDQRFSSIEIQGTGSYYEHLKISKPDEFDIMLKLPQLRFELEPCDASASTGAFYCVKLKRCPAENHLSGFLDDNERLSAFKMLAAIRNIIIKEVKKIEEEKVQVEKKKPGCPAVTLLIGEPTEISVDIILALEGGYHNQCASTKNGLNIERWLGTKVKQDFRNAPLCLVPKNVKDGKCLIDCWRLSFSHIEKDIIMHHGNEKTCCEREGKKCCRKACLKLLKYLLELLKTKHENRNQFDKFCSYHAKTALFQACVKWPHDSEWRETDLDDCFEKFLDFFLDCLKSAALRHFFIPEFNFFSTDRIEIVKCKALTKAIENERNNRFPVFSLEP